MEIGVRSYHVSHCPVCDYAHKAETKELSDAKARKCGLDKTPFKFERGRAGLVKDRRGSLGNNR